MPGMQQQSQPNEKTTRQLPVSLKDLYTGTTKKLYVTHKVLVNGIPQTAEEIVKVEIKPGWKKGTKITFKDLGDETMNGKSDLEFVIDEINDKEFTRDGDDLKYELALPLKQALLGTNVKINHPGGFSIDFNSKDKDVNSTIVFKSKGMPKKPSGYGDLLVNVKVLLPSSLSSDQRNFITANF